MATSHHTSGTSSGTRLAFPSSSTRDTSRRRPRALFTRSGRGAKSLMISEKIPPRHSLG